MDNKRRQDQTLTITAERSVTLKETAAQSAEGAATLSGVRGWIEEARRNRARHLIIACDTFNFEDYPVPVGRDERVRETGRFEDALGREQRVIEVYRKPLGGPEEVVHRFDERHGMQRALEVYSLTGRHTLEDQLAEARAFYYD